MSEWTQKDMERENEAFHKWFEERGYPDYPNFYPLITENGMHSAWQESAKRQAEKTNELLKATKEVYAWMNNLPIPTSGCLSKMQILYNAISKAEERS